MNTTPTFLQLVWARYYEAVLQLLEIGDLEDAVEDAVRSRLGLGGLHQFAKAVGPLTNYVNPTRRARSGNHIHTVCHPTHCARSLQLLEC